MKKPQIPQDDVQDVIEMTVELEKHIGNVLKDKDIQLSISALMNACINCMLDQCDSLADAMLYRELIVKIMDVGIEYFHLRQR